MWLYLQQTNVHSLKYAPGCLGALKPSCQDRGSFLNRGASTALQLSEIVFKAGAQSYLVALGLPAQKHDPRKVRF